MRSGPVSARLFVSLVCPAVLASAGLGGCSGGGSGSGPTPTPPVPAAQTIYALVPNLAVNGAMEVVAFSSTGTGTVSPVSTLVLPTDLTTLAMTTDSSGQIYVAGTLAGKTAEVLVYAAGSRGNATPARTVLTGQSPNYLAGSVAVDSAGQIYVATNYLAEVEVFAANASGTATPVRTLQWDASVFKGGQDMAVDGSGSLYVLGYVEGQVGGLQNPGEIVVYGPNATGNATPVRTIVGSNALFSNNNASFAVDSTGNLFAVVSNPDKPWLNATEIAEYAPDANGNAAPIKMIAASSGTFGVGPTHLGIDAGDNVYAFEQYENVDDPMTPTPNVLPSIAVFSASASGSTAPSAQFTSAVIQGGAYGFSGQ